MSNKKDQKNNTKKQPTKGVMMKPRDILAVCRSLNLRRVMVERSAAVPVPPPIKAAGWTMVPDVKTPSDKSNAEIIAALTNALQAETKAARGALASCYGHRPVPFVLPVKVSLSTTGAAGVLNATSSIDITTSAEFASLAVLFDEYRFVAGDYRFAVVIPTPQFNGATTSITYESCFAIGFDPSDATAATSTIDIAQLEHHTQLFPRIEIGITAATIQGFFGKQDNSSFNLKWRYSDATALTGNGGVVGPGMWKSTQGNVTNFPDGTVKAYYQSSATAVIVAVTGTMYWHVEFRNRT
jgi:hypothetical protein